MNRASTLPTMPRWADRAAAPFDRAEPFVPSAVFRSKDQRSMQRSFVGESMNPVLWVPALDVPSGGVVFCVVNSSTVTLGNNRHDHQDRCTLAETISKVLFPVGERNGRFPYPS